MDAEYIVPKLTQVPQAQDFVLDSYLIHKKTTLCACGNRGESSAVFEVWTRRNAAARNLRPAKTIRSGLEIGMSNLPVESIPVCHACYANRPEAEKVDYSSEAEWRETLKRKYATPQAAPKPPQRGSTETKSPAPDLDQL